MLKSYFSITLESNSNKRNCNTKNTKNKKSKFLLEVPENILQGLQIWLKKILKYLKN